MTRFARSACALVLLGALGAAPATAQDGEPNGKRRWLFAALGAALMAIPAALADEQEETFCGTRACLVPAGAAAGATVGFLIGRELDARAARGSALGPTVRVDSRPVELDLTPELVSAYDGGAVVVGREGLALVGSGDAVRPLWGQIRNVRGAVAFPGSDAILASAATGLYAFPLSGERLEGEQVETEGATVLEALGSGAVLVGGGPVWRRLRLGGRGSDLSLTEDARAEADAAAAAEHAPAAGVVWTLEGVRLSGRSAAQLTEVGGIDLPVTGRTLSLDGGRALVGAGSEGLLLLDIARPEEPTLIARVGGLGFVHDAILVGQTAYIASGSSGLVTVDLTDPANASVSGVARDLGFVADLALEGSGPLYAVDRRGRRLHVVELRPPGAGSN